MWFSLQITLRQRGYLRLGFIFQPKSLSYTVWNSQSTAQIQKQRCSCSAWELTFVDFGQTLCSIHCTSSSGNSKEFKLEFALFVPKLSLVTILILNICFINCSNAYFKMCFKVFSDVRSTQLGSQQAGWASEHPSSYW